MLSCLLILFLLILASRLVRSSRPAGCGLWPGVLLGLAAAVALGSCRRLAGDGPPGAAAEPAPKELVSRFADERFRVRQDAADRLAARLEAEPRPTLRALEDGLKSRDAEVAGRCRELLTRYDTFTGKSGVVPQVIFLSRAGVFWDEMGVYRWTPDPGWLTALARYYGRRAIRQGEVDSPPDQAMPGAVTGGGPHPPRRMPEVHPQVQQQAFRLLCRDLRGWGFPPRWLPGLAGWLEERGASFPTGSPP